MKIRKPPAIDAPVFNKLSWFYLTTLGASAVRGNKDSSGDPKKKYFVWKTYSDGTKIKEYIDKDQIQDYAMSKKGKFDGDDQVNISQSITILYSKLSI